MNNKKVKDNIEPKPNRKSSNGNTVTVAELSEYLNVSKASIYSKIYSGDLDVPYIQMGKMLRFLRTDVEEWVNRKREESINKDPNGVVTNERY